MGNSEPKYLSQINDILEGEGSWSDKCETMESLLKNEIFYNKASDLFFFDECSPLDFREAFNLIFGIVVKITFWMQGNPENYFLHEGVMDWIDVRAGSALTRKMGLKYRYFQNISIRYIRGT